MINSRLMENVVRHPVVFERGSGVWLYDREGKEYLDFFAGYVSCCLGHAHPALVSALQEQVGKLWHVAGFFYNEPALRAADAIVDLLGPGRVYLCNSGAEANETAIKLARKHAWRRGEKDRNEIVAVEGGFHGRTLGALSATMQPAKWEGFGPMPPGFVGVPVNDAAALDRAITDRTAAVIFEPIQGEIGVRLLTAEFGQAARALTKERGALLMVDEIQTGVGRTGKWWGFEHLGITPDVVAMGKGIGGGFPVGATWAAEHCSDVLRPSDHGTTFGGNPLAGTAIATVLEIVRKEGIVERAAAVGERLERDLASLGTEVRGKGMLFAVELGKPIATQVLKAGLDRGIVLNDITPTAVRVAPPLVISDEELDEGLKRLASSIEAVS